MVVFEAGLKVGLLNLAVCVASVAHPEESVWVAHSGAPTRQRHQGSQQHALMRRGPSSLADTQGLMPSSLLEETSGEKADVHEGLEALDSSILRAWQDLGGGEEYDPYFLFRMQERFRKQKSQAGSLSQGSARVHSAATAEEEEDVDENAAQVKEMVGVEVSTLLRSGVNCSVHTGNGSACNDAEQCSFQQTSQKCLNYDCVVANYATADNCATNSVCQWNNNEAKCDFKVCGDLVDEAWCVSSRVCKWSSNTCKPQACNAFDNSDVCGNIAACQWDAIATIPNCAAVQCEGFDQNGCQGAVSKACSWQTDECLSAYRLTQSTCTGNHVEWINNNQCVAKCSAFDSSNCEAEGEGSFHPGCSWAEVGSAANTCIRTCSNQRICMDSTAEECSIDTSLNTNCPALCGTCANQCDIYGEHSCGNRGCTWVDNKCKIQCNQLTLREDCEEEANNHCSWSASSNTCTTQ